MNLKDSICVKNPERAAIYTEGSNCEIFCLLKNMLYTYSRGDFSDSSIIYHDSLTIDEIRHCIHDKRNQKDYFYSRLVGLGRGKGEDVVKAIEKNRQFLITTESDGISFKDLNSPSFSWKHTNVLESECVGYTSDYKYLFIVDVGYRGAYGLKILEMNTGKIIYEPKGDSWFDDFYYCESEGILLFKQLNGDMILEDFPMYNNLMKMCQERVKGMSLTPQKRYDFFIGQ